MGIKTRAGSADDEGKLYCLGCKTARNDADPPIPQEVSKLMGICWLCPPCFQSVDTGNVKRAGASGDEIAKCVARELEKQAAPNSMDEQLQAFKSDMLETMNCTMKAFMEKFDKSPVTSCATPQPANSHSSYAAALNKPATTAKLTVTGDADVLQSTNSLLTKTPTTYRRTNTDGSVVYGFKTAADLTRATEKINSANTGVKMEEYVSKPLLTIRNAEVSFIPSDMVDKQITDKMIIDSIKVLNSDIVEVLEKGETMEVIFFQRHRQRPDLATVGLRVTRPLSELLLNKGHIHLGHFLCPVEKRYSVKQCFKCQGFGHVLKDCKAVSPKCFRCAGDHYGRECDKRAREFRKCSNCAESSNPLFKSGAMSHNAASIDCPILLQHVKSKN